MAKITAQILSSDSTYFVGIDLCKRVGKDACRKNIYVQTQRKVVLDFPGFVAKVPPPLNCRMALKRHNLFSI
jgi:hypothetical protein